MSLNRETVQFFKGRGVKDKRKRKEKIGEVLEVNTILRAGSQIKKFWDSEP